MWFSFRTGLTQWENQHYVERNSTKMACLWDHRASTRHSPEVQIVAQDVWLYSLFDACSLGCLLEGIARCFRIGRLATTVPAVAWKEPDAGFSRQAPPVRAQFFEQFWAEHHISIYASLACLN